MIDIPQVSMYPLEGMEFGREACGFVLQCPEHSHHMATLGAAREARRQPRSGANPGGPRHFDLVHSLSRKQRQRRLLPRPSRRGRKAVRWLSFRKRFFNRKRLMKAVCLFTEMNLILVQGLAPRALCCMFACAVFDMAFGSTS